jgi:hypothetical protein
MLNFNPWSSLPWSVSIRLSSASKNRNPALSRDGEKVVIPKLYCGYTSERNNKSPHQSNHYKSPKLLTSITGHSTTLTTTRWAVATFLSILQMFGTKRILETLETLESFEYSIMTFLSNTIHGNITPEPLYDLQHSAVSTGSTTPVTCTIVMILGPKSPVAFSTLSAIDDRSSNGDLYG